MKHLKAKLFLVLGLLMAAAVCMTVLPSDARAASPVYKEIKPNGKTYSVGGTKFVNYDGTLRSGGREVCNVGGGAYTDKKVIYAVSYYNNETGNQENRLLKIDPKDLSVTEIKKWKESDPLFSIACAHGKLLYLNAGSFDKWKLWVYTFDPARSRLEKVFTGGSIEEFSGNYAAVRQDYRTDITPWKMSLCKFTKTGLKKVKQLSKNCSAVKFIGKRLYYADYTNSRLKNCTICSVNMKGKDKKKPASFKAGSGTSYIWVNSIGKDSCKYTVYGRGYTMYKYTYKTKKKKVVEKYDPDTI